MGTNIFKGYRETNNRLFSFLIYLILGLPILGAGLIKFINPSDFASSLKYSLYFPDWLSILIAIIIPIIEIIIGLSLIFDLYRNISIITYRLLLICFLLFHIWNNFISVQKPCNCFGNLVEFSGIWMMIIILVLLIISFIHLKSKTEKNSFNSFQKNFSKKNIILVVSIVVLILAVGYVRWLRIERELNTGLISHTELPEVRERFNVIYNKYFSEEKNNKYTLVIILRGKLCISCLNEIYFWNNLIIRDKINITIVFHDFTKNDIEKYKIDHNIKLNIISLEDTIYNAIIGRYPKLINRILFNPKGQLIRVVSYADDNNEKSRFLSSLKYIININ